MNTNTLKSTRTSTDTDGLTDTDAVTLTPVNGFPMSEAQTADMHANINVLLSAANTIHYGC